MAGPFPKVTVLLTDNANYKWVSTNICGPLSLVELKDVGAPICKLRVTQETGGEEEAGELIFESELPLNFNT